MLAPYRNLKPVAFESRWMAPANIAFVKYWGKKGHQLPANPSFSMALNSCTTTTRTCFSPSDKLSVELKLEGKIEDKFGQKIYDYLMGLSGELPWLKELSLQIETSNTFPHGAGIASSASGLAAFVLTFTDYLRTLKGEEVQETFLQQASFLSRLASGSACRSVYGGFSTWGKSHLAGSSDEYATPFKVHPELNHLLDTVLVIDSKEKKVSSRAGHGRMNEHFFAQARFKQADANFASCVEGMQSGDFELVGKILEAEALSLHAMMLTSPEAYTLLRPNTLAAIEAIWDFRRETKLPLYFTLDAGPNLHLIYPKSAKNKIYTFINHELLPLAEQLINDKTGTGPQKCL